MLTFLALGSEYNENLSHLWAGEKPGEESRTGGSTEYQQKLTVAFRSKNA